MNSPFQAHEYREFKKCIMYSIRLLKTINQQNNEPTPHEEIVIANKSEPINIKALTDAQNLSGMSANMNNDVKTYIVVVVGFQYFKSK